MDECLLALSAEYEPRSMTDQVPLVWQRAERCWVEDADENVFLDFTSGVVVANAGHSHPRLVAAMREQADQVVNCYDFPSEWRVRLAQKLVEITPSNLDKAVILTTGAETTEAAIKMARLATGRYEIISFHGGFHGRTFGAMTIGGRRQGAGTRGYGPFLPGVVFAPFPYCYRCPFGSTPDSCRLHGTDYLDWLVETETEGRVAAVITETYQGAAGSVMAPPGWFPKLAQWCRDRDILLIIDEVQASFGRTGKLFCYEHYDVVPNILCLGKGISSSVPLSAVVAESRIMDALSPGSMGSTHGGNAFCSRVALENIEVIIGERLSENAAALSGLFSRAVAADGGAIGLRRRGAWPRLGLGAGNRPRFDFVRAGAGCYARDHRGSLPAWPALDRADWLLRQRRPHLAAARHHGRGSGGRAGPARSGYRRGSGLETQSTRTADVEATRHPVPHG